MLSSVNLDFLKFLDSSPTITFENRFYSMWISKLKVMIGGSCFRPQGEVNTLLWYTPYGQAWFGIGSAHYMVDLFFGFDIESRSTARFSRVYRLKPSLSSHSESLSEPLLASTVGSKISSASSSWTENHWHHPQFHYRTQNLLHFVRDSFCPQIKNFHILNFPNRKKSTEKHGENQ